jgi:quinol monooxygenase YgiN
VGELMGIARFRFKEGRRKEFQRLAAQAMEIVKAKEPGTLQYDTFMNEDMSECVVIERYRDSEAALEHFKNVGHLFEPIFETVTVVHGELLGDPNEEVRANLAGSEVPALFTLYESM